MTLSNFPMHAVPVPQSHHAPSVHSPAATASPATRELDIAAAPMPTELAGGSRVPAPPAGVSTFAWEMLLVNIGDAQRRAAAALAPLREAVQALVRELRAANQTWEQVYAILHGVVAPEPERPVSWAMGYETHSSRSAALVAHMQSWADVERLAEIEAEAHAG
jgi:hypothetical protein